MIMIKIKLKLYATLSKYLGQSSGTAVEMELLPGSTLDDVVKVLRLPPDEVKICFINGRICELEQELKDGDDLGMFPPIGGGAK